MVSRFTSKLKDNYNKLMNLPDAPDKVAGGVAIGVGMDFLPIPIISIPVSYLVARAVGLNGLAAALTAMLLKWAVPFFYAINIMVGRLILMGRTETPHAVFADFDFTKLDAWLAWFKSLGQPFLIGAGINSLIAFVVVYFAFKKFMLRRQQKFQQKQISKNSSQQCVKASNKHVTENNR